MHNNAGNVVALVVDGKEEEEDYEDVIENEIDDLDDYPVRIVGIHDVTIVETLEMVFASYLI
jgi:hypothetical protein